jgi:hypothetical protein
VHGNVNFAAEDLELSNGCRALAIARNEEGSSAVLGEMARKLGRQRRLARALKPDEHDDGGRRAIQPQLRRFTAQKRHELIVHDLDELLAGADAPQDILPHRSLADAGNEITGDAEVDIRLK